MPTTMRADALRNEAEFLPAALSDLVELRRRVIDAGYRPSVANGLVGWLVSKGAGERDVSSSQTRSQYRKILAELDKRDDGRPGRGRSLRRQVIEAGYPASVASGLVGWLLNTAAGDLDLTDAKTRSRYLRILAELAELDDGCCGPKGGTERPPIILAPVVTSSRRPQHVDKLAELAA